MLTARRISSRVASAIVRVRLARPATLSALVAAALLELGDDLQVDADRRERLTGGVVELAGDHAALGLLQQHGARRQLAQALLLGLRLLVGELERSATCCSRVWLKRARAAWLRRAMRAMRRSARAMARPGMK
jgi:hypothetical protein